MHCLSGLLVVFLLSVPIARPQHCYACSNMDSGKLLANLEDKNWKKWLENANKNPHGHTDDCLDEFEPEVAIRSGARSVVCQNGTCLKLSIAEHGGGFYVWRTCIPGSASFVRSDCTKVNTEKGKLELCTCFGILCNFVQNKWTTFSLTAIITLSALNVFWLTTG